MTTSSEIEVAAVEPHAHHGAVENQPHDWLLRQRAGIPCVPVALHLAPHSAHRVLANLPTKYAAKRTPHAARIGAGKIHTGDQRVGSPGAALIIPQYPASKPRLNGLLNRPQILRRRLKKWQWIHEPLSRGPEFRRQGLLAAFGRLVAVAGGREELSRRGECCSVQRDDQDAGLADGVLYVPVPWIVSDAWRDWTSKPELAAATESSGVRFA